MHDPLNNQMCVDVSDCHCDGDIAQTAACETSENTTKRKRDEDSRQMLDEGVEGDDIEWAREMSIAAQCYDNLRLRYEQPEETRGSIASLAELRTACFDDLNRHATEREAELYYRVHMALDWDARHELLAILNSAERYDGCGGSGDCFGCKRKFCLRAQSVRKLIYDFCCFDKGYCRQPAKYTSVCLCGMADTCINPQHFACVERHQTKRKLRKRSRVENDVENARLDAMAACLDDHFAILCASDDDDERRLVEQSVVILSSCDDKQQQQQQQRQQKEDYFDTNELRGSDGERTPTLQSYVSACATPTQRECSVKMPPPTPPPPPSVLLQKSCRTMANELEALMTMWHKSSVVR